MGFFAGIVYWPIRAAGMLLCGSLSILSGLKPVFSLHNLKAGEMLDGEGGLTVWANALLANISIAQDLLPMGLAHYVRLVKDVVKDKPVRFSDVHFKIVISILLNRVSRWLA